MMLENAKHDNNQMISITIDNETVQVPQGYTLATAITSIKGLGFRKTRYGDARGPMCNMGTCFECSVFLDGSGFIRACMIQVENGMRVWTDPDESVLKPESVEQKASESEYDLNVYDVVIVGAGPAGMSAAEELSQSDVQIALIDEQENRGGQIYRKTPQSIDSIPENQLVQRSNELKNVDFIGGNTAWFIQPVNENEHSELLANEEQMYRIYLEHHHPVLAKQVVIATGAHDKILPFKGWNKAGVMSGGGLQVFAKTQHFLPGQSVLLVGSHPFLLLVAKEIIDQGGQIKGIAFSQPFPKIKEVLPMGISSLRRWKKSKELLRAFQTVRKSNVPIWFNSVPIEAKGEHQMTHVELIQVDKNGGLKTNTTDVECDVLGVCYGFDVSSEIPRQLSAEMEFNNLAGGWLTKVDDHMKSSLDHVYVAGELTGVGGAELSEIEGRIAGVSILNQNAKGLVKQTYIDKLKKERASWIGFAKKLGNITRITFDSEALLKERPDTFVCRCEEVTYEQIMNILRVYPHLTTMNAVKLMTRCGMGLCQGRYCEGTLLNIMQNIAGDDYPQDHFSVRTPFKPTIINNL